MASKGWENTQSRDAFFATTVVRVKTIVSVQLTRFLCYLGLHNQQESILERSQKILPYIINMRHQGQQSLHDWSHSLYSKGLNCKILIWEYAIPSSSFLVPSVTSTPSLPMPVSSSSSEVLLSEIMTTFTVFPAEPWGFQMICFGRSHCQKRQHLGHRAGSFDFKD